MHLKKTVNTTRNKNTVNMFYQHNIALLLSVSEGWNITTSMYGSITQIDKPGKLSMRLINWHYIIIHHLIVQYEQKKLMFEFICNIDVLHVYSNKFAELLYRFTCLKLLIIIWIQYWGNRDRLKRNLQPYTLDKEWHIWTIKIDLTASYFI